MDSSKLSDLIDQLAEKLPEEPLVKEIQDEYASLYADEEGMEDEMGLGEEAPAEDAEADAMGSDIDSLLAEDEGSGEEADPADADLSDIFAPKKDEKKKPKKPNPFEGM